MAGSTITAWLTRLPYQGTRPRSSRSSVTPTSATHPPAAGPPKKDQFSKFDKLVGELEKTWPRVVSQYAGGTQTGTVYPTAQK